MSLAKAAHASAAALLSCGLGLLGGCADLTVRTGLPVERQASPNFTERRPNFVVLHYTSNNAVAPALRTLTSPFSGVSAHYLIGRDGSIYYLVDEWARAWHAGEAYWGGVTDVNSISLGIELDNDGSEPFAEPLLVALSTLLADLKYRYAIPAANFLGHSDVAPRRKVDPGDAFPWQRLAAQGFGIWCNGDADAAPGNEDDALLLAAFGYDVADFAAAVSAFRLHYAPLGTGPTLTASERSQLRCLNALKRDLH